MSNEVLAAFASSLVASLLLCPGVYPVDEYVFSKHSESIAGPNDWAYALTRDVCPGRKQAMRTASVRFEVSGVPLWMDLRRDWLLGDHWER